MKIIHVGVVFTLLLGSVSMATPAEGQVFGPGTNFRVCTREWADGTLGQRRICGHRRLFRSSAGNGGSDTAIWDNAATVTYRRAWEGFWYLDTTNYAIWIDESSMSASTYTGWEGTNEVFHRANTISPGVFGRAKSYHVWPSDCVNHADGAPPFSWTFPEATRSVIRAGGVTHGTTQTTEFHGAVQG